jgi:hypothetical protein
MSSNDPGRASAPPFQTDNSVPKTKTNGIFLFFFFLFSNLQDYKNRVLSP